MQEAEREILPRVQIVLEQDELKREKEYNAILASVEAEAWKKVVSERGLVNNLNDVLTNTYVSKRKGVSRGPKSADRQCGEVAGCDSALAVLSVCSSDQVSISFPQPITISVGVQ